MVVLYRGFRDKLESGEYKNHYLVEPRTPLHTPQHIHDLTDSWFESRFQIRARSTTLMCSTYINQAKTYGTLTMLEPAEPYSLIYSPIVNDLYAKMLKDKLNTSKTDRISKEDIEKYLDVQQYKMVHSSEDVDPSFRGEVHVFCLRYRIMVI
jgi:hypothetical protein